ncbi:DUF4054 domain-containing protein [Levilactobacillus andaensis]|uniref:DUF4054 domain-containing protein n=1 Tax=Levilactobacillus andaensis TaxID=2799570 RepID=UPI001941EE18|nr:DUF4054 domain-containing protein [Levilactobacillus andaensis]
MAVEDEGHTKLMNSIKLLAGADAAGVSDEQLEKFIDIARAYVGTFKPPEAVADQLTALWVAHLLAAKIANLGTVKINSVWIERESASGNQWFDQFWSLLNALGLGKARVIGF